MQINSRNDMNGNFLNIHLEFYANADHIPLDSPWNYLSLQTS